MVSSMTPNIWYIIACCGSSNLVKQHISVICQLSCIGFGCKRISVRNCLPTLYLFAFRSSVATLFVVEKIGVMGKKTMRLEAASPDVRKKAKGAPSFPAVADMGASSIGGSPAEVKTYRDQDIHCTCLIYCNKGSVYSSNFDDGQLVVVLMECGARPSPLYNLKLLVQVYGQAESNQEEPPPDSLEQIASRYGAEYTFVWKKDG